MSGPSVVVDWAPEGWTHIGGPGMHLLIALDEDDEQTLVASDAADGGDLDDVLDVLTTGGMRRARHFVGVHWQPHTRLVAHGPVAVMLTLADGSEHEVRATSSRVWTDVELPEHPTHVRLRVLDETEAKQPPSPALPVEWPRSHTHPVEGARPTGRGSDPETDETETTVETADSAAAVGSAAPAAAAAAVEPVVPVPPVAPTAPADPVGPAARVVPTFGGSAATGSTGSSDDLTLAAQLGAALALRLDDGRLSRAVRTCAGTAHARNPHARTCCARTHGAPTCCAPVQLASEDRVPGIRVRGPARARACARRRACRGRRRVDAVGPSAARARSQREDVDVDDGSDSGDGVTPSYDYLFGHTTTVDEHRRVLAELERPARGRSGRRADRPLDRGGTSALG